MRILIDGRLYGLEHAGLGRYTMNLVEQLKLLDRENNYVIVLRNKYFNQLKFPRLWKKVEADFRHYSLIEQIKLPAIISKENPDIVHFPHFNIPVFYKGNFVVTIHDLLMQEHRGAKATTLPPYLYFPKQIGARYVFRRAIESSLKVIVPSDTVKKEVTDFFKIDSRKVVVTYEGVDYKTFTPAGIKETLGKYKISPSYFIYSGNAYPHKNLVRAIKALVSINRAQKEKIIFAIASSRNVFTEKLRKDIARLDANRYVRHLGFVSDNDLAILYKNSLGFIFPSLSEGFGLPGLEAISAGTVALVSDTPVFREIYEDTPLYFDPYDVESIEAKMKEVIRMGREDRQKFIEKGQEFVKRYSWSKMARQTLKVYESCAGI